jgi:predicted nucleic acid-binding protein
MDRVVLLDANVLGVAANPGITEEVERFRAWLGLLTRSKTEVVIPEIADYEIRRELVLNGSLRAIRRLDQLKITFRYLPITTETMMLAASFWARARKMGRPTAHNKALDGDVILAAQATLLERGGQLVVVATDNIKHLGLFVQAQRWQDIR